MSFETALLAVKTLLPQGNGASEACITIDRELSFQTVQYIQTITTATLVRGCSGRGDNRHPDGVIPVAINEMSCDQSRWDIGDTEPGESAGSVVEYEYL
ncbi:MAG: hypothetical protein R3308_01725 [Thiohalobacterales bacterium]|nr:hypothetical protein [Thiohalobacterales bacterium]